MNRSSQTEQIRGFLYKYWPNRCELAGSQSVEDIVVGAEQGSTDDLFKPIQGGADFDMASTLKIVAEAATIVKTTLDIYAVLSEKLHRKPKSDELEQEVKNNPALAQKDPEVLHKLPLIITELSA